MENSPLRQLSTHSISILKTSSHFCMTSPCHNTTECHHFFLYLKQQWVNLTSSRTFHVSRFGWHLWTVFPATGLSMKQLISHKSYLFLLDIDCSSVFKQNISYWELLHGILFFFFICNLGFTANLSFICKDSGYVFYDHLVFSTYSGLFDHAFKQIALAPW